MSDVSSELGADGRKRTVHDLASRLHHKASAERLSLSAHLSIGRLLCKLRDAVVAGEKLNKQEAVKVTRALLKQSAMLIFVLLAAVEARDSGGAADAESARAVVDAAGDATLAHVLDVPSRKRAAPGDDEAAAAASGGAARARRAVAPRGSGWRREWRRASSRSTCSGSRRARCRGRPPPLGWTRSRTPSSARRPRAW